MQLKILIMMIILILQIQTSPAFPKKLFTFWHGSVDSLTKVSLQSMRRASKASNWQLIIINRDTIVQYLSPQSYSNLQKLIKADSSSISLNHLGDLVRLFALYDNGGMWMDASIYTFDNLDWVHNLDNEPFIHNKVVNDPQMVLVTMDSNYMGNNSIIYDKEMKEQINLVPSFQFQIFISMPKCRILHDFINRLLQFSQTGLDKRLTVANYYGQTAVFDFGQQREYHYYSDFLFEVLIQQKDKEMQMNPGKYTEGYAMKYYKIWCLKSEVGPYYLDNLAGWENEVISDFLGSYPLKMVEEQAKSVDHSLRFIKLNQGHRGRLNTLIANYPMNYCFGNKKRLLQKESMLGIFLSHSQEQTNIKKIYFQSQQQRQLLCKQADFHQITDVFSNIKWLVIIIIHINVFLFWNSLKTPTKSSPREILLF